ncbi:MAG: hypothetical protein ACOYOV_12445 [Bacteroidales bacterium]
MPKQLAASNSYLRILEWVMNRDSIFISETDKEQFDRWDYCDNQLRKYGKQRDVEAMMRAKFKNISISQIKRDIDNAKRLFNSITTINKDYEKLFLIEDIKETILEAKKTGNLNARTKAQRNLYLVLGLDKDDEIDLSKLENHEYILAIGTSQSELKIDLMNIHEIPFTARKRVSDVIESEITEVEAYKILNPNLPDYDSEETES